MNQSMHFARTAAILAAAALGMYLLPGLASGQSSAKNLAQTLVEEAHAQHPEATEIGIAIRSSKGCHTIASTDSGDIGEKCEKDDLAPIQTGKPFVEKEKRSYDVSLALHDAAGRPIGSVGIELKPGEGQTEAKAIAQAEKIAREMEKQIASKASLSQAAK